MSDTLEFTTIASHPASGLKYQEAEGGWTRILRDNDIIACERSGDLWTEYHGFVARYLQRSGLAEFS